MDGKTNGGVGEWENYIIPVFGGAIVVLVLLVLCQFYAKSLRKYFCPRAISTSEERDRRYSNRVEEDLPPTYSVLTSRRTNFDLFRVENVDDRSSNVTTVTDKLPSYKEIVEQQKQKAEQNEDDKSLNIDPNLYEVISLSGENPDNPSDESVIFTESEIPTPPPYRPRTARSTRSTVTS